LYKEIVEKERPGIIGVATLINDQEGKRGGESKIGTEE
jgi:hypothetical protein